MTENNVKKMSDYEHLRKKDEPGFISPHRQKLNRKLDQQYRNRKVVNQPDEYTDGE